MTEKASEPSSPADPVVASSFSSPPPRPPCLPVFMKRRRPRPWAFLKRTPPTLSESSTTPHFSPPTMPLSSTMGKGRKKSRDVQDARKILDFIKVAEAFPRHRRGGARGGRWLWERRSSLDDNSCKATVDIRRRLRLLQRYTVNLYPTWVAKAPVSAQTRHSTAKAHRSNTSQSTTRMSGIRLGELPPEEFTFKKGSIDSLMKSLPLKETF